MQPPTTILNPPPLNPDTPNPKPLIFHPASACRAMGRFRVWAYLASPPSAPSACSSSSALTAASAGGGDSQSKRMMLSMPSACKGWGVVDAQQQQQSASTGCSGHTATYAVQRSRQHAYCIIGIGHGYCMPCRAQGLQQVQLVAPSYAAACLQHNRHCNLQETRLCVLGCSCSV